MDLTRLAYSLLFYALTPLICLRLWWRGRRQPGYRRHLGERFGYSAPPDGFTPYDGTPWLWLHAVSVGETRAAQPVVRALLDRHPDHHLVITGMTPTGRDTAESLYLAAGFPGRERIAVAYLPYDLPGAVNRFIDAWRPKVGVLMETELWPNLVQSCAARQVPVVLANARLSERSARGYQRFSALVRPAFSALAAVAAQTRADAERLAGCGAGNIAVCGNVKFDVAPPPALRDRGRAWRIAFQAGGPRPVLLAASTREGEEPLVLDAFAALRRQPGLERTLLVLVPRHPQRFDEVATLAQGTGLALTRRSTAPGEAAPAVDAATDVWLGDSLGEMPAYYACADLAFIGGSLVPLGGQNLIEAAACGCPVLIGPHTFNFAQATRDAAEAGAARQVADAAELASAAADLLTHPTALAAMQNAATTFSTAHRGATERVMAVIDAAMRG